MNRLSSSRWLQICFGLALILTCSLFTGCQISSPEPGNKGLTVTEPNVELVETEVVMTPSATRSPVPDGLAEVISVQVTGNENSYQFSVEISSPDTGCEQYADWWEILTEDGTLIYRRILAHSHRDEQPFVRSGGPVNISEGTAVIIRAHMFPTGYGGAVMKGSVGLGFETTDIPTDFAEHTESESPLPDGCAF